MKTWLVDDVLMKVDKASMATAIEARVPLLDHVLVEHVSQLSDRERVGRGVTKKLLREFARDLLPRPVVERPKRAFEVPVDRWLREYRRDWVYDTVASPEALGRGYFDARAVTSLLDRYFESGVGGKQVWNLFCLELWHRQFIDEFLPPTLRVKSVPCVISS
jgi:asparagine synthase (glutamine-hydrolysing)